MHACTHTYPTLRVWCRHHLTTRSVLIGLMLFEHTRGETHILLDARWKSSNEEKRDRTKSHAAETPTARARANTHTHIVREYACTPSYAWWLNLMACTGAELFAM